MSIFDLFHQSRSLASSSRDPEKDGDGVRITEQVNPTMMVASAPTQED